MARTRRPRTHRTILGVLTLAAATITVGCGSDETASDTAASDAERRITIYSGRSEELIAPLLDRFTDETGIAVDVRYGDSGELAAQILTEGDATTADLFFSQDAGALGALGAEGRFAELDDELVGSVPAAFRATDDSWVGTSGRARVVVYDPAQVSEPPTGIDDLLDERWTAKIGFAPTNASWQSFVTALRVLRGEDGARRWLEAFAALEPVSFEKNAAVRDAVDEGEIALGLVNHYYLFEKIAAEGADAVSARNQFLTGGDPGGLLNVAGVGLLASSEHRTDATALIEYLLSDAGQRYFVDETFEYPTVEGVAAADDLPTLAELDPPAIDLSDLRSIEATQQLLADVGLLTR